MSIQNFFSLQNLLQCSISITTCVLAAVLTKRHLVARQLLKNKVVENKKLEALLKEYESDQSIALEHLTAKKDKVIKELRIQHAKWREATWAQTNKEIEGLKAVHAQELAALAEQTKEVTAVQWQSAATMANMDRKHKHAIISIEAELEQKHQEAMEERSYQFDIKRAQYAKFFKIVSEYSVENRSRISEKMLPVFDEFQRNYIRALNLHNKKNASNAITVAKKKMDKLVLEAQLALTRLNDDANAVILISSEAVSDKIVELIEACEACLYLLVNAYKQYIDLLVKNEMDRVLQLAAEVEAAEDLIAPMADNIFELVRQEVGEF